MLDRKRLLVEDVWKFFDSEIERYGYNKREGQEDMSLDIVDAINSKENILVEAEVGIGKSFAYLVPLIYHYKYNREPIIIASSTIALQEQLKKDIEDILSILKVKRLKYIVIKGQNNFICKKRLEEEIKFGDSKEKKILKEIQLELEKNRSDRMYFSFGIEDSIWKKINIVDYGPRLCNQCSHQNFCYYKKLRNSLVSFNGIIICNQDLLIIDLLNQAEGRKAIMNESTRLMVIDEAHNLEEKYRSIRTETYNSSKMRMVLKSSLKLSKGIRLDFTKAQERAQLYIDKLYRQLEDQIRRQIRDYDDIGEMDKYFIDETLDFESNIYGLYKEVKDINTKIQLYLDYDRQRESHKLLADELESLYIFLRSYVLERDKNIYWLEIHNKHIYICKSPKNISYEMNKLFFENQDRVSILTSATLTEELASSEEESYSYIVRNIGFPLDRGFLSEPKKSPYPYEKNTMLYYTDDLPHPTKFKEEYLELAVDRLEDLLKITGGRALVLFSSLKDMDRVYEELRGRDLDFKIFKQGENGRTHRELLEEFRSQETSVLLGSGAYSEGVNIQGSPLSHLIIFKLPFPVPDPILEYKASLVEDGFKDVYVPEMLIKLKQAVGRLIRSEEDRGLVSILDPRLSDKFNSSYRKRVFDILPVKNRTSSLSELEAFYKKIL